MGRRRHCLGDEQLSGFHPRPIQGLSLTRDGQLESGPKIDTLFASDQPIVWSMARGREGAVYAATGHRGRLYEIDKSGNPACSGPPSSRKFSPSPPMRLACYTRAHRRMEVYRIVQGKASEYFAPDATYIWSLAVGPDGALYVGTGDQGKIFRVTSAGKGEVYYETGQAHVTSLALDRKAGCWAGSEPNGILYRVTPKIKPSYCMTRTYRKSAPSSQLRMARSMRPLWAARRPGAQAHRKPRRAPARRPLHRQQ